MKDRFTPFGRSGGTPERTPLNGSRLKDPDKRAELRKREFPHVLTTEGLSADEREMVNNLIGAANQMADIFSWQEYREGPNDIRGYFWPKDATKEEIENASRGNPHILDHRAVVRRDSSGLLVPVPMYEIFEEELRRTARFLREAAKKTRDPQREDLETMAESLSKGDLDRYDEIRFSRRNSKYRINHTIGFYDSNIDRFMNNKYSAEGVVQILDERLTYDLQNFQGHFMSTYEKESGQKAPEIRMRIDHTPVVTGLPAAYGWSANALPPQSERLKLGSEYSIYKTAMDKKVTERILPAFRVVVRSSLTTTPISDEVTRDIYLKRLIAHEVSHSLGNRGDAESRLQEFYTVTNELYCDLLSLYLYSRMQTVFPQESMLALELSLAEGKLEYIDYQTNGTRYEYFMASSVILKSLVDSGNAHIRNGIINFRNFPKAFETIQDLFAKVRPILETGSREDAERFFGEQFENIYGKIPYGENGSR